MQVFKFGGSSIRNAESIRNLGEIVKGNQECKVVVISALGKTTNNLEDLLSFYFEKNNSCSRKLNEIKQFHFSIIKDLYLRKGLPLKHEIEKSFSWLEDRLKDKPGNNYDKEYDQIVSLGEIWSTLIVHTYLLTLGVRSVWLDARDLILTDRSYRDARIDWDKTEGKIKHSIQLDGEEVYLIQGFIGGAPDGSITTLGREGSDFTAAILGNILNAESVIAWKDVPGILNADPASFKNTEKLEEISYLEAVELAFFGAKVIHPKTIKPLHNKQIPLFVKSFENPASIGTIIHSMNWKVDMIPIFVKKDHQILITLRPRDFSFMIEQSFGQIFSVFNRFNIKIYLVQTSAISLSICADTDERKMDKLLSELNKEFQITFNEEVQLVTIRHYTREAIRLMTEKKQILIEQKSRQTVHFVLRDN